jgi:hypothetical protein
MVAVAVAATPLLVLFAVAVKYPLLPSLMSLLSDVTIHIIHHIHGLVMFVVQTGFPAFQRPK